MSRERWFQELCGHCGKSAAAHTWFGGCEDGQLFQGAAAPKYVSKTKAERQGHAAIARRARKAAT